MWRFNSSSSPHSAFNLCTAVSAAVEILPPWSWVANATFKGTEEFMGKKVDVWTYQVCDYCVVSFPGLWHIQHAKPGSCDCSDIIHTPCKNFHLLNLHGVLFLSLERKLNTPKINLHDNHRASLRVECICDMHKWHTELNVVCHVWEREQSTIVRKTTDRFHVLQQSHPHFVTTSQYVGVNMIPIWYWSMSSVMLYCKLVAEQTYKKGPWHSLLSTTSCVCLPSDTAWH